MQTVEEFLAHAIRLEEEAALRFAELADAMESYGNAETGQLFRKLSDYARMHLAAARARAGYRDIPALPDDAFRWPGDDSPERADIWAADPLLAREDALKVALEGEKRGHEFYQSIAESATDPEIRGMAEEFTAEEAEHVAILEAWIAGQTVFPKLDDKPAGA